MWQRIQTVYLVLVAVLSATLLFFPVAGLHHGDEGSVFELNVKGISLVTSQGPELLNGAWVLTAITVLIPLLSVVTILLFKKRILQIRLVIFTLVLLAGYYGLLFIYLWQYGKVLEASMYLEIIASFPLICIVLDVLALRAIGRDEALVKSLNRIR